MITPAEAHDLKLLTADRLRANAEVIRLERRVAAAEESGIDSEVIAIEQSRLEDAWTFEEMVQENVRIVARKFAQQSRSRTTSSHRNTRQARPGGVRRRGSRRGSCASRSSSDDPGGDPEPASGWLYASIAVLLGALLGLLRSNALRRALRLSSPSLIAATPAPTAADWRAS